MSARARQPGRGAGRARSTGGGCVGAQTTTRASVLRWPPCERVYDGGGVAAAARVLRTCGEPTGMVFIPKFININKDIDYFGLGKLISRSELQAGDGDDYIIGGVGGNTVNGGNGFDYFIATTATLEPVYNTDGNLIDMNGVIVDLSSSKVTYLGSDTEDTVTNTEKTREEIKTEKTKNPEIKAT